VRAIVSSKQSGCVLIITQDLHRKHSQTHQEEYGMCAHFDNHGPHSFSIDTSQHNGEISQGASKTSKSRPWMMQMIIYGFPSKLAALQFEWAWQNPHMSRHLRDPLGKSLFARGRGGMKKNVL
jgi:hypothetical protein